MHRVMRTLVACVVWSLATAGATAQERGTIAGQVTADGAGLPLTGARVVLADPERETVTDGEGRFSLSDVPPGERMVVVMRDGYATLSQPVTVATGATVTLEVSLPAAPTLAQELTVLGRLSDYVEATASAARTSARLIDIPQAIQVLPARFLDDIGALDTKDLYKHISGVTDSPYSSTVVRGFTQREVLVNGVRGNPFGSLDGDIANSGFSTSQFRLTNVERVEILKGPSSVLYGSGEPGGVINYITKKPREAFEARATVGTGQYSQGLGEVEVTGPANAARTLLYRAAFYFEDRDSFRNNANTRNGHAVGNLVWRPSSRTSLGVEYEYIDQRNDGHRLRGIPVNAGGTFLTGYTWTATEPTDFTDLEAHVAQVRLDQGFARGIRLDTTFRYLAYDRRENYHEPRGIAGGGTVMQREFRDQLRTNDDWTLSVNLAAPLALGRGGRHDLAVGADIFRQDHLFRFATARQQSAGGPVLPLSLPSPVYGVNPASYGLTPARYTTDTADTSRMGVYAQDLLTLSPRWNVLLGGRVDTYDDEGVSSGVALDGGTTAVTGRAGVVFKPVPLVSLYGSVANGFSRGPILSQAPSANGPHDPETSRQAEVGVKTDLLQGRLQVTAAWFDSTKRNVLRPDPALGPNGNNANAVFATGEVRNRGLEIDVAGEVLPRWNLAFNYAYLDSAITKDPTASLIGRQMPNAAPHKAGLFTRVDLPFGAGVGGSVEAVDDRVEPFAGIRAPGYVVVDLHYFQQVTPRIRMLARIDNVFDRQYAASSLFVARAGNIPGQPRTFSIALTVTSRAAAVPRP